MNIAMIGCGRIGFLLEDDPLRYKPCTHYGGMRSAGLRPTHACDINSQRLGRFSEIADIPKERCFTQSADLFRSVKMDLAVIATWTDSHGPIAIDAAKNGARVIVLEKPITPSLEKAKETIAACRKHGAAIIINHERRYDSRYRKLKSAIDSGKIGTIKTVHACILTSAYRGVSLPGEGGGPLLHDGTHLVDIIRYIFGDVVSVAGEFTRDSRKRGFEDRAVAWLKTVGGVDIFLEAGGSRDYFVFELEISGTEGKFVIGNGYESLYVKRKSRFYSGFKDIDRTDFPSYKKNSCFTELYRETKRVLKNKAVSVTSGGNDGYKALEAIHAIYLSSHLGGKRIALPVSPDEISIENIFVL